MSVLLSHLYRFEKFKFWGAVRRNGGIRSYATYIPLASQHLCFTLSHSFQCCYCSVTQSFLTLCDQPYDLQHTSYQSFTVSQSLLRFMSIESVMPSNYLILCCPLLLLPSIFPSIFSNELSLHIRSDGQSIRASVSVLTMNMQDWFPLGWTGWISLLSKGLWRGFSSTTVSKHQFFGAEPSLWSNSHIHTWLLERP